MRHRWAIFALGAISGVSLLAAGVLVAVYSGAWVTETRGGPSSIEKYFASAAVDASLRRHAPAAVNPFAGNDVAIAAGMKIYRNNCAGCHGDSDRKPSQFGLGFFPPVPQFPLEPTRRSQAQAFYVVKNGIRRTGMTAWGRIMSDDDIWRVVSFVTRMDSLPAVVDSAWRSKAH